MNYFYDLEFLEGVQKKFRGFTPPTIDLISIGVVAEDGREFYEVSKEFNLKEAWNRFDVKTRKYTSFASDDNGLSYTVNCVQFTGEVKEELNFLKKRYGVGFHKEYNIGDEYKDYWIRDNVLKPIFDDFIERAEELDFTYRNFKKLLKLFGKSRVEIRSSLTAFLLDPNGAFYHSWLGDLDEYYRIICKPDENISVDLYGYYSAYNHIGLSWLYGKMIDLPEPIPMYTKDLKQILDSKFSNHRAKFESWLKDVKDHPEYPKQKNEHNALDDARWNKDLYNFIEMYFNY